jgi:hypothetical protein
VGSGFLAFSSSLVRCRWQAPIVDMLAASLAQTLSLPPPESQPLELSNRRIVCLAPPARVGAAETVNLTLSLNAIDFGATGLHFQYYDNPYVARIIPSGGHRTGGTLVTLVGTGFDALDRGAYLSCQYGEPTNAAYNPRYTITRATALGGGHAAVCESPPTKLTDTRQLWLALNGFALESGRDPRWTGQNYTYYNPPSVQSVLPQAGVFSGGTVVTIFGQVSPLITSDYLSDYL